MTEQQGQTRSGEMGTDEIFYLKKAKACNKVTVLPVATAFFAAKKKINKMCFHENNLY